MTSKHHKFGVDSTSGMSFILNVTNITQTENNFQDIDCNFGSSDAVQRWKSFLP